MMVPPGGKGNDGVKLSAVAAFVIQAHLSEEATLKKLICGAEGDDRPRINPKMRENAATKKATKPTIHFIS